MKVKKKSLFKKYFMTSVSILLTSILIMGIALLGFVSEYWTKTQVNTLKENVSMVADTTEKMFKTGKIKSDNESSVLLLCNMLNLVSSSTNADIFICDLKGNIILCKDLITTDMEIKNEGTCKYHEGKTVPKKVIVQTKKGPYYTMDRLNDLYRQLHMIVGVPIVVNNKVEGYVFATKPVTSELQPYIIAMLKLFIFAALITIAISSIVVYLFTYGFTKPLREMSKVTKSYANGDFSKRVSVNEYDEFGELAEGLNSMAKALAALESSRRSFVANVSHELKTPMTTISGFIDGILDGTIPPEKQDYYLTIVSSEVKRLSRLVVSMLNMSKIEAGQLNLKIERFDISKMTFNILVTFEQSIEKHNINIEGLDKIKSIFINADEDLIHQVIYNLIDNAVKFTDDGGSIYVSIIEENQKVIAGIRNTGEGIPTDEIGKVFERFYKVDKSRSEDVKGAGLGLYLVKKIIELHGGQIAAHSKEGQYTEFIFWLPKNL